MSLFVNKAIAIDNNEEGSYISCGINDGKKIANFDAISNSIPNSKGNTARFLNTKQFDATASDTYIAKSELYSRLINNIVDNNSQNCNHSDNSDNINPTNKSDSAE